MVYSNQLPLSLRVLIHLLLGITLVFINKACFYLIGIEYALLLGTRGTEKHLVTWKDIKSKFAS
ncbi:MAG: hypothetical protein EA390_15065 [Balneolaceae bacterium]|nr:MAG: hypothetical protein EA390_15065 [Balneolaceae bacterium]